MDSYNDSLIKLKEEVQSFLPIESPTLDFINQRTHMRLKAYIITMMNNHESVVATRKLLQSISAHSCDLDTFIYDAVTPKTLPHHHKTIFGKAKIPKPNWGYTYPKTEEEDRYDLKTGLRLKHYPTVDLEKRIACFFSHYNLWRVCYDLQEPIMILEHDAIFTRQFRYAYLDPSFTGDFIGLNSPIGATRKASVYDAEIKKKYEPMLKKAKQPEVMVYDAPYVDDDTIPQGLAGNSAYIITPQGAARLIALVAEHGIWPNDAIMCKQLNPGKLQQAYPYYTKVQNLPSTTSG